MNIVRSGLKPRPEAIGPTATSSSVVSYLIETP